MKRIFLLIFFSFFFFSCEKELKTEGEAKVIISDRVNYIVDGDYLVLETGKFENKIPLSKLPFKSVMLLNSSFIGYFLELNLEKNIIGVSSPEYIFSDKIKKMLSQNLIQNIGNEQKYNIEKILSNKPDVIFTNYVPSFENTYDILKTNNIEVVYLDEYLEQDPLDKSKYLLLFGKLFGKEKEANLVYDEIENNYNKIKALSNKSDKQSKVLLNEMYGSQWFLPGGETYISKIINDAGGSYILKNNKDKVAIPLSFEEVFMKSKNADFWLNVSAHKNKKEMLSINSNYGKLDAFKNGKLFMINNLESSLANDYFESGVVRSDLVLRDYFKIFNPDHPFTKHVKLKYLKQLE